jgi:predicted DNA repair protein MutK
VESAARLAAASVDDVSAAAGRASMKAAGVVVDDTAVTPQYVQGVAAKRELPMIKRIAIGSIRNKLLFILPAALLLSQFLPWLLTPILMLGGTFLCYEGAEKIWEKFSGHHPEEQAGATELDAEAEKTMVSGAIRTDLILSAEIMAIALSDVSDKSLPIQAAALALVGVVITILVYGVVALIVKPGGPPHPGASSPRAPRGGRGGRHRRRARLRALERPPLPAPLPSTRDSRGHSRGAGAPVRPGDGGFRRGEPHPRRRA